jgi:hypothetical protein
MVRQKGGRGAPTLDIIHLRMPLGSNCFWLAELSLEISLLYIVLNVQREYTQDSMKHTQLSVHFKDNIFSA